MYDYVKMVGYSVSLGQKLLSNKDLKFDTMCSNTNEVIYDMATFKTLKIKIFPLGRVQISGSLHKYCNNGNHNHNDFNMKNVAEVINDLWTAFGIDPTTMRVENLEFGVNVLLQYDPSIFLDNLVVFKNHSFNNMAVIGVGNGKVALLTQYSVKIYNKSLQYHLPYNVLRYERKVVKMEYLRKCPIYLSDLLDPKFASDCLRNLLKSFEDLIVAEQIDHLLLSKKKQQIFRDLTNPRNWKSMTPKQRCYRRSVFESIIEELGTQHLKAGVYNAVKEKGLKLINCHTLDF